MDKHLINSSMEISFDSETMALKTVWNVENSSLSENEYIDCWIAILRYIEVFTPKILLIDAYLFDFRVVTDLYPVMVNIQQSMKSNNVAIVMACSIKGKNTINDLIKKCVLNEWIVFDSIDKGQAWLVSRNHFSHIAK